MILQNNRLHVTIDEPGKIYKGSRFDWTGQVSQVILDNSISFCGAEKADTDYSNSGKGLCNEFGIVTPVGYSDCPVGGFFPKIGIGLLQKENQLPYNFFQTYENNPASLKITQKSDEELLIVSTIDGERGYACRLTKAFQLSGTRFSIHYLLENTGLQTIDTEEYCHNFVSINHLPVNREYKLTANHLQINNLKESVNPGNCVKFSGNTITWEKPPQNDFFFTDLNNPVSPTSSWIIENSTAGAAISESVDSPVITFNLWGRQQVISPELFVAIHVEPERKISWTRNYQFINYNL